jgi:hypothetical protein
MERSDIRDFPGFAALYPGYAAGLVRGGRRDDQG